MEEPSAAADANDVSTVSEVSLGSHSDGTPEALLIVSADPNDVAASLPEPAFAAPPDLTDARKVGEWQGRYLEWGARWRISIECAYVGLMLVGVPLALCVLYIGYPRAWYNIDAAKFATVQHYGYAYLGGVFGGTLYTTKWLYHTIATGFWNADRFVWRVFTPFLAGGISLMVILLISARVLPILGSEVVQPPTGTLAVGIFVGFVSDKGARGLNELADRLFDGRKQPKREQKRQRRDRNGSA